jgi:predicted ATP-dependent endonuclease of OLD family
MKKESFIEEGKDINLLFIEEPEAHTHPQMQYKFIDKIKKVFSTIDNLQTVITTHSAQIVSRYNADA